MHFYFIFILWSHNHSVSILKTKTQNRYIFRLLKIIKSPYTPNGKNPWRTWLNCRNKCAPPLQFVSWRAKQSLIYWFIGHPRVAILVSYSLCCYLVVCRGRDSNWNEQGAAKNPFTRVDKGTHQHNPNMHSKSFFRARDFTPRPRKTQVSYSHAPIGVVSRSNAFRLWILSWKVLQELVRQLAKLDTKQEELSFVQRGALKGDSRCSNYKWRWNMKKLEGKNEMMYFGEKGLRVIFHFWLMWY